MDYLGVMEQLGINPWLFGFIIAWSAAWKLMALWKSARKGSVIWFIVLALVNTVGILEILYIFLFSEIKFPKAKKSSPKRTKRKRRR